MNQLIPPAFFADMDSAPLPPNTSKRRDWRPTNAILWYDGIIDDLLSHPGTTLKDCAARLGRHPNTISLITCSDMFRARYAQRRADFNQRLHDRLTGKLTQVAEAALDHTITVLDKKRESIPLPLLHEIAKGSLDRLGYAPQGTSPPAMVINNVVGAATVSAAGLERARSHLRELQARPNPATRASVSQDFPREAGECQPIREANPPDPVAGPESGGEGEED
jgi:hypothetical protein